MGAAHVPILLITTAAALADPGPDERLVLMAVLDPPSPVAGTAPDR